MYIFRIVTLLYVLNVNLSPDKFHVNQYSQKQKCVMPTIGTHYVNYNNYYNNYYYYYCKMNVCFFLFLMDVKINNTFYTIF